MSNRDYIPPQYQQEREPQRTLANMAAPGLIPQRRSMTALPSPKRLISMSAEEETKSEIDEAPFSILSNTSDTVKVLVRIRPPNAKEQKTGYINCVRQPSDETLLVSSHPEGQQFTFDYVAGDEISQGTLFQMAGAPIVESVLSGYNSCIFAYGQTGSGKTYTMLGDLPEAPGYIPSSAGLTPRVLDQLFRRVEQAHSNPDSDVSYVCRCSLLEIYNEMITDLLNPDATNLLIREDNRRGTYVEGLTEEEISSVEEAVDLIQRGAANRTIAETNMNTESSRSHCVMTIIIESRRVDDLGTKILYSRLNLVDLAGSERQRASGAMGERLKEASSINKSLSTLGLVIMSLVDSQHGKGKHVPYRDSKLTFLLQDSLGGNAKTVMIANISPAKMNLNETLSTLRFARGAKRIKNKAVVNEDYGGGNIEALRREIARLKEELAHYKEIIESGNFTSQNSGAHSHRAGSTPSPRTPSHRSPLTQTFMDPPKGLDRACQDALRREEFATRQLKGLVEELNQVREALKMKENDIQKANMIVKFREDKIQRLERSKDQSDKQNFDSARDMEVNNLREELQILKEKLERTGDVTKFAVENMRLKNELLGMQQIVDQQESNKVQEELETLRAKCLHLNTEVERFQKFDPDEVWIRAEEAASKAVAAASKRLEESLARAHNLKRQSNAQVDDANMALDAEKTAHKATQDELAELKSELQEMTVTIDNVKQMLEDAVMEREMLEEVKAALEKKINELEIAQDNNAMVVQLEEEREQLKAELELKLTELDRLREEVGNAEGLSVTNKEISAENSALTGELAQAKNKIMALQSELDNSGDEVREVYEQNLLLKIEEKKLRDQVENGPQNVVVNIEVKPEVSSEESPASLSRDLLPAGQGGQITTGMGSNISTLVESLSCKLQAAQGLQMEGEACDSLKEQLEALVSIAKGKGIWDLSHGGASQGGGLNEELKVVKAELEKEKQERNQLGDMYQDLMKEVKGKRELQELCDRLTEETREVGELREVNEKLQESVKQLEEGVKGEVELEKVCQQLQKEIDAFDPMSDPEVNCKIMSYVDALKEETEEKKGLEKVIKGLQSEVQELHDENKKISHELQEELDDVRHELCLEIKEKEELDALCKQLQTEVEEFNRQEQERAQNAASAQMTEESVELQNDLKKVTKEKEDLEVLCNQLMKELDKRQAQQDSYEASLKAANEEIEALRQENKDLEAQVNVSDASISLDLVCDEDTEKLKTKIKELEDDVRKKDKSVKNMDVLLNGMMEENVSLKERIDSYDEMMDDMAKEKKKLGRKIGEQEEERKALEGELKLARGIVKHLRAEREGGEADVQSGPRGPGDTASEGTEQFKATLDEEIEVPLVIRPTYTV